MKRRSIRFAAVSLALALLLTPGFSPALRAPAAWAAAPAVDEAQHLYDTAKFSEAVAKLRDALNSGQVTGSDVIAARALLARCLVKAGNRLEAKQAFKTVLRADPAWRPDAVMVPPDEMDVFNLALKEINAEQIEAGQRVPASLCFFFGAGSGSNKELGEFVKLGGGDDKFNSKTEFGGSVRFPLKPRLSLDIELARFRATDDDTAGAFSTKAVQYEATAIPLLVNLYWTALPRQHWRGNVFAGLGPLMAARVAFKIPGSGSSVLEIADERQGFIFQGGVEGEYLFNSRFSVSGRLLGRSATATGFFKDTKLNIYNSTDFLDNRKVDFSGYGAFVALRAYIGY